MSVTYYHYLTKKVVSQ